MDKKKTAASVGAPHRENLLVKEDSLVVSGIA
jgi:hypothetical protein